MAKRDFITTRSATHVTVTITRKAAERMSILLEDAGDWFGNIEPADIGMTAKQISAAEDDVSYLTDILGGEPR